MWAGRKRGGSLRDTDSVLVKMTAVIRNEDVARPVHRNAVRALQLACAAAIPPKGPHRPPRRGEVHDAVVAPVHDEDVARPVHRNAVRMLQLARAAAIPPKGPHRPPRRGEDHDAVVAPVRDVGLPAPSTATAYGFYSSSAPLPRCLKARAGGASPACMAPTREVNWRLPCGLLPPRVPRPEPRAM
jgi:hypothetical protein